MIEHVDLGGGLGIPYRDDNDPPPSPEEYAESSRVALPVSAARSILSRAGSSSATPER